MSLSKLPRNISVAIAAGMLGACTGLAGNIDQRIDTAGQRGSRLVREVGQVEASGQTVSTVVQDNGIWIGRNTIKRDMQVLPAVFNQPATFDRSVLSLADFAERMTARAGIATRVSPDALAASTRPAQAAAPGAPMAATPAAAPPVRLVYSGGNFKGLLDMAAARYGVSWKYADGAILFFHTDTRTFQVSAIPGDASLNANVSSSASNGGAGGDTGGAGGAAAGSSVSSNNAQNTAVKSELSVFGSLEKSVAIMLSVHGKVIASPATGTLTVTDTPATLERVAAFIDGQNKALARQVMVNVTVLAVTLNQSDNYGIKWDLVYQTLRNKYQVSNTMSTAGGGSAFTAGILSNASRWGGSQVVIDALSDQGRVRRETTASVVTLNNQPVPIQVAKQTAYLKSTQTTLTANVGSTTTLTPGTVTSGFNMSILPHVLDNGVVMLQFSTDISSLVKLATVESGGVNNTRIQTPEIDTRNFLQRVAMKSNETLVISGFEQTDDNLGRSGVGSPANFLFGGGVSATSGKEIIVILVTPVVMNGA
jgi:type IVB pilus formation R64 PilN family outer membrane protein